MNMLNRIRRRIFLAFNTPKETILRTQAIYEIQPSYRIACDSKLVSNTILQALIKNKTRQLIHKRYCNTIIQYYAFLKKKRAKQKIPLLRLKVYHKSKQDNKEEDFYHVRTFHKQADSLLQLWQNYYSSSKQRRCFKIHLSALWNSVNPSSKRAKTLSI